MKCKLNVTRICLFA